MEAGDRRIVDDDVSGGGAADDRPVQLQLWLAWTMQDPPRIQRPSLHDDADRPRARRNDGDRTLDPPPPLEDRRLDGRLQRRDRLCGDGLRHQDAVRNEAVGVDGQVEHPHYRAGQFGDVRRSTEELIGGSFQNRLQSPFQLAHDIHETKGSGGRHGTTRTG